MSYLDRSHNILHTRIVYWGPQGSGKTATLSSLHRTLDPEGKYRLYRIADGGGATACFDMLPIEEHPFGPHRVRTRVFGLPGHPERAAVREALLRDADAVVFVADSSLDAGDRNRASVQELDETLRRIGRDPASIPRVTCLNRQDLLDLGTTDELAAELGVDPETVYPTVATEGTGVYNAFRDLFHAMLVTIAGRHAIEDVDLSRAVPERLFSQLARRGVNLTPAALSWDEPELVVVSEPIAGPEVARVLDAQIQLVEAHVEVDTRNHVLIGRNRELMAVNRVARSILSAMEADNLLVVLLDSTAEHLGATHASVVVFDPARQGTLRTHVLGFGRDPILDMEKADAAKFFELVERSDGPVAAQDNHHRELLAALRRTDTRIRHAVYQPIKDHAGRPAGWLGIYAVGEDAPLSTQSLLFLSSISRLAALGLDKIALLNRAQASNSRQGQEVAQRTGELELANAKIRALNRGLEARVAERTRALEEANSQLLEARAQALQGARLGGMGHVAASFAHEANNPVAGLSGNLEFMRECLDDLRERVAVACNGNGEALEGIAEFAEVIEESRQSIRRVTAIIGSLKRFGGEEKIGTTLNLNAAVADAVTLLEERIRAHAQLDLCLGALPELAGDGLELSHSVLALLTNAVEAIERKGEEGGRITVTTFESLGEVTLTIKDSGIGIEEKLLGRVFEPFVSTKEGEHNAGLGLHGAYKVAQRHGGTIRIRSRADEGTTVTMVLPVLDRSQSRPSVTGASQVQA